MLASSISRDNEISIIELIDNINLIVYGSLLEGAFLKMQDYANTTRRGAGLPYKWIVACTVVFGIFMSILNFDRCQYRNSPPANRLRSQSR